MPHPVDDGAPEAGQPDPLARFRDWRGFLLAALAVNGLFVWGMLGQVGDPATATWHKALVWLPFNCLATVVYYVVLLKLGQPGAWGLFYKLLCGGLIIGNWLLMLSA
ncbi:MAG TPA: hypothetical protein PLW81_08305 [Thiobacillaceae bacterium]|nr:hypothetical protein [Thiobacillaceae bacterium]